MYCKKCGKPTEEGQRLCPECLAAEVPAPEIVPAEASPDAKIVVSEEPLFELNLTGEETPTKGKKAKKEKKPPKMLFGKISLKAAIISGVSLLAVTGIVLAVIFLWPYITDFFARTFQSPEEYKNTVEENALTREDSNSELVLAKRGVVKVYGAFVEALCNGDGASAIALRGELTDELATLLNTAMTFTGGDATTKELVKSLRKLNLDININENGELVLKDFLVHVNGQDLAGVREITDSAGNKRYIAITDNGTPIGDYACYDMDAHYIDSLVIMARQLPSEEDFSAMLDTFLITAIREIKDVEMESASLEAAGVEQSFTVLTYEIDAETFRNISVAVLEEAASNATFRKILNAYSTFIEATTGESYPVDDMIDVLNASAERMANSELSDETLVIETYVDKKGYIQGRKIILDDFYGGKNRITYLTATGGFKQGFSLTLDNETGTVLQFEGTATLQDDLVEGSYKLEYNQEKILTVKLKKFDPETFTGTIQITPGDAVIESLTEAYPMLSFVDISKAMVEITLGEDSIDVAGYLNNRLLATVGLSIGDGTSGAVSIPSNTFSVSDAKTLAQWQQENITFLLDRLEAAGLESLADMLNRVSSPETESNTVVIDPESGQINVGGTSFGTITVNPDGTYTYTNPDGTSVTTPIIQIPDGSSSTESYAGTVTITPSAPSANEGKQIVITPINPGETIAYEDLLIQAEKAS